MHPISRPADTRFPYLPGIDALRALAVLAVFFYHAGVEWLPGGFLGVDLFFVISGFVMCVSTQRSGDRFLRKRLIRIVPLYWGLTGAVFLIALLVPGALESTTSDPGHLLKSLLFVPFDKAGRGHYPLLFLGWTLNYEMMFYLLFAMALTMSQRNRAGLAAMLVFGLFGLTATWAEDFPLVVYGDPIVFEFCMGMIVFLLLARPDGWAANALVAAAAVAAGLLLVEPGFRSPGVDPRVGLTCAVLLYGMLAFFGRVAVPAALVLLGEASYALYLTHPYVVNGFEGLGFFAAGGLAAALATVATAATCFGVAIGIWLWLERPLGHRLRRRAAVPRGNAGPADGARRATEGEAILPQGEDRVDAAAPARAERRETPWQDQPYRDWRAEARRR